MSKEQTYYMLNDRWEKGEVVVSMKITPKTITITPTTEQPRYKHGWQTLKSVPGSIDRLWKNGKIIIRELRAEGKQKIKRDYLREWGDGTYTLYPDRAGEPFLLVPVEGDSDDSAN